MSLRAEVESILSRLRDARARKDVDAARALVLWPSSVHEDSLALLPEPGGRFVDLVETDDRWVVYGVAIDGELFHMRHCVAFLSFFRGRDGQLRLETSFAATEAASSSSDDLSAAFAQGLETRRPPAPAPARARRWSPPPARPNPITSIRWLGPSDTGLPLSEVDAAERVLGVTFPAGYREYVTGFGAALECNLVRIYPPRRVLSELAEWRLRVDAYWLWAQADEGLDRDRAQRLEEARAIHDALVALDPGAKSITHDDGWTVLSPALRCTAPRSCSCSRWCGVAR